jgi:hypothetical protein
MKRVAALFVPLALSACGGQRVVVSKSIEDEVKIEILRMAKDPDSVEFGGPFVAGHRLNFTVICGYVNWKNGFGGRVGWTLLAFMVGQNGGQHTLLPDPLIHCALANATPPQPSVSAELMRKHGIEPYDPLVVPSDYNLRKRQ